MNNLFPTNLQELYIYGSDSKIAPPLKIGYPDLLIEGKVKTGDNLNKYSYAKYRNGELKTRYGNFPSRFE